MIKEYLLGAKLPLFEGQVPHLPHTVLECELDCVIAWINESTSPGS
jgi:hypothetical protein